MKYYGVIGLLCLLFSCNQNGPGSVFRRQNSAGTEGMKLLKDSAHENKTDLIAGAWLIVAGKSIGRVSLDENMDSVLVLLGKPDAGNAAMGKSLSTWYANHDPSGHQTTIFAARQMGMGNEESRVKQIRVTSPFFKTREGVGVTSSAVQIGQFYHMRPVDSFTERGMLYIIYDTDKGIGFEIDQHKNCSAVIVHSASEKAGAVYLPFH